MTLEIIGVALTVIAVATCVSVYVSVERLRHSRAESGELLAFWRRHESRDEARERPQEVILTDDDRNQIATIVSRHLRESQSTEVDKP